MTIFEHDRVSTGRDDESGVDPVHSRPCRSSERRRTLCRRLRRTGQRLAGDVGGAGVLGRYRGRARDAGRGGRAAAGAGGQGAGRRPADRFRAAAVGARAGRRRAGAERQAADVGRRVGARRSADPDRRRARPGPPGHGPGRHAAGGGRGALPGRAGRRGARGRRRQGCRAAGAGAADRCGRHAGGPPPRHHGPRRPPADGLGHQRRPGAHLRAARRVRPGRADRAAAGAVDPQRPALRRHHRNARAAVALRAVLRADRRGRSRRPQEQGARRRGVQPGLRTGPGRGRLPHAAAVRRHRHRRPLGRAGRPRRRPGPRDDRGHPGSAGGLGRRDHRPARSGRPLDPRPRPRRHPDPADRAGDPRTRRRHRARGHPWRPAQPVHRRRGARGGPAVVELRAESWSACPTAR